MNKTIEKCEAYKRKTVETALEKARAAYEEARGSFNDTGYDRYYNRMEKLEQEINELEEKGNENIAKGQCLSCQFCQTRDDGYKRSLICTQTKRGKELTWIMHVGQLSGGFPTGNTVIGGSFTPDPLEKLDKYLKDYLKNRIPPKWCKYRKDTESAERIKGI